MHVVPHLMQLKRVVAATLSSSPSHKALSLFNSLCILYHVLKNAFINCVPSHPLVRLRASSCTSCAEGPKDSSPGSKVNLGGLPEIQRESNMCVMISTLQEPNHDDLGHKFMIVGPMGKMSFELLKVGSSNASIIRKGYLRLR